MDELKPATLSKKFMDELVSRIKNNEPVDSMFSQHSPLAIRDMLEEAAGTAAGNAHPYDLFEKPELLKNVPIQQSKNSPNWGEAHFGDAPKILVHDLNDKGTIIHEAQHMYDELSRPGVANPKELTSINALKKLKDELGIVRPMKSVNDIRGLEETTQYLAKHFKPDVEVGADKLKQLVNLERIVKGQPLKSIAHIIPLAGAGLIAAGAMNKAHAGDFTGAALDAASIVDPTGLASVGSEMRDRFKDPEYAKQQSKEDYLKALPPGMDIEQQAINSTEDDNTNAKLDALKKIRGW